MICNHLSFRRLHIEAEYAFLRNARLQKLFNVHLEEGGFAAPAHPGDHFHNIVVVFPEYRRSMQSFLRIIIMDIVPTYSIKIHYNGFLWFHYGMYPVDVRPMAYIETNPAIMPDPLMFWNAF